MPGMFGYSRRLVAAMLIVTGAVAFGLGTTSGDTALAAGTRSPAPADRTATTSVTPAAARTAPTAIRLAAKAQGHYIFLWEHGADFGLSACLLLPSALLHPCSVAARVQAAHPQVGRESLAERAHYAALFQQAAHFPASDCPLLPARLVATCLAALATPHAAVATTATPSPSTAAAAAPSPTGVALQCVGVSATTCDLTSATTPGTAAGAKGAAATGSPAALTATQSRDLYYWTHDANFSLKECGLLPASLLGACQVAVRVQLAAPKAATEPVAARQRYAKLFEKGGAFPQADCAYLPAEYVASCVAQPAATPTAAATVTCVGTSSTVCDLAPAQPSTPAVGATTTSDGTPPLPEPSLAMILGQSGTSASGSDSSPHAIYPGVTLHFPSDPSLGLPPMDCPLTASGPTLFFSDAPEEVPGPGILYQDTLSGNVRIYMYQVDNAHEPLRFGALLTNPGQSAVTVYVDQRGSAGPSSDFVAVGKQAEHLWFEPFQELRFTLAPGSSRFLGNLIDHPAAQGQAVNAIYDLKTTGDVQITALAEASIYPSTAGLPVLPPGAHNAAGTAMRGTFPSSDLTCSSAMQMPASGKLRFAFGRGSPSGSFLRGYSAVDGGAPAVDYGNYGVLYHMNLGMTASPSGEWDNFALLLHPRGNPFAGTAITTGGVGTPGVVPVPYNAPYVSSATDAVLLGIYRFFPLEQTSVNVSWMSAASTSLPIDILFYPMN